MEKRKIKLAIFDIDDTLIKRGKITLEKSAKLAIDQLKSNGIEVMVATGRAFYFIHDDIHESISPNYYVTTNGACVYDKNIDLIFKIEMDLKEVTEIIKFSRNNQIGVALKEESNMPVFHNLEIFETVYMQGSSKQHILVDKTLENPFLEKSVMGMFLMGDEDTILATRKFTQDTYAKAYDGAYDIYSKNAGKIKGIEHVLEILDITWNNVIAFGDAANDQEMIEKAEIGVAMGNSTESLKRIADFVTSDIEDDGVYNALKHFKLI